MGKDKAKKVEEKVENVKSSPKKVSNSPKEEVVQEPAMEMKGGDFDIDKSDVAVMSVDINEYVKNTRQPMFPWQPHLSMEGVSISQEDEYNGSPKEGDMIAFNPLNPNDMWLVAKKFFNDNYIKAKEAEMVGKSLANTDANGARKNVKDIVFWGNGDTFKLISKASSEAEGWMKSTKAMDVTNGVVVQVTTQQRNPDGTYAIAEAVTYVPGVRIVEHKKDSFGEVIERFLRKI